MYVGVLTAEVGGGGVLMRKKSNVILRNRCNGVAEKKVTDKRIAFPLPLLKRTRCCEGKKEVKF